MRSKIAILYTGGTIGMAEDPASKRLVPLNFKHLHNQIPELNKLEVELDVIEMWEPLDSSDLRPKHWIKIADKIEELYNMYNGFVVLHGTDTMAYTASALSFMLQNLNKPVIITGSQLPIGVLRTDGKENLITAIQIAAEQLNGAPRVPEVCIYFEYKLMRGNRATKLSTEHFDAFRSPNYPCLAEAGVNISYQDQYILGERFGMLSNVNKVSKRVGALTLYPGFNPAIIDAMLDQDIFDALVLEGFGTGNIGNRKEVLQRLERWCAHDKLLAISTQCVYGSIYLNKYASSGNLSDIGAIDTKDQTFEACITKMMVSLGSSKNTTEAKNKFAGNWAGERKD